MCSHGLLRDRHYRKCIYQFPSPYFGIASHFVDRVVDVHCILDHSAVLKHLDLFGYASDGEVVTVSVKLNTETKENAVKDSEWAHYTR